MLSSVNVSKQLIMVEKWHQVEVGDIMTGSKTNGGNVGGETGQNKHKQNVRGKKDRYHRPTPFSSTSGQYADMPCSGVDKLYY